VKRTYILATFLVAISLISTSCGTGDKIGSVSMTVGGTTGTVNLIGLGGTLQLQVNANYTSGKIIDETNFAVFTVVPEGTDDNGNTLSAPPLTLTINNTGLITAVDPAVCTWISTTGQVSTPGWAYTGDYKITATYRGFTSNPVFIPVASAAGPAALDGECGPTPTS